MLVALNPYMDFNASIVTTDIQGFNEVEDSILGHYTPETWLYQTLRQLVESRFSMTTNANPENELLKFTYESVTDDINRVVFVFTDLPFWRFFITPHNETMRLDFRLPTGLNGLEAFAYIIAHASTAEPIEPTTDTPESFTLESLCTERLTETLSMLKELLFIAVESGYPTSPLIRIIGLLNDSNVLRLSAYIHLKNYWDMFSAADRTRGVEKITNLDSDISEMCDYVESYRLQMRLHTSP